jgi:tetratricopeptide (TPR) repeat protein
MMHTHNFLLAVLLGLGAAACKSNSLGHRDPNTNPDELLAGLMSKYEKALGGDTEGLESPHVLIDGQRVQNEIERLAVEYPRHVPTLMANAVIAYDTKQSPKAENYLNRIFAIAPVHPEAAILAGRISVEAGNLPSARRLLQEQVHLSPDHPGVREAYSSALFLAGDLASASSQLDVALRLGAPPWRVAFNRGLIAEKRGDGPGAQREFEAAVEGNPNFRPAQARLAGKKAETGYNKGQPPPGPTGGL